MLLSFLTSSVLTSMCSSTPPVAAAQEPAPNTESSAIPPPPLHRTDDEDDAKKNGDISQNNSNDNSDNNKEHQEADNKHHQAKDNPRIAVCPVLSSATTKITNTHTSDLGISVKQILFHDISSAKDNQQRQQQDTVYSWQEPPQQEKLHFHEHFSSLLLRGSVQNTLLEFALLLLPFVFLAIFDWDGNQGHDDNNKNATIMMTLINVEGSMPMRQVAIGLVMCCIIRRIYNTYLEAIYFTFPSLRTQPPKEHRLSGHPRNKKDLMGRDRVQLDILESHDKWTLVSQFVLNFALYYALPGFYPAATTAAAATGTTSMDSHSPVLLQMSFLQLLLRRFLRLVLNHYVLSFGMYWAHRSLHVIPWLWDNIHSLHHYARHPLSRNTYEDHWLDNLLNSILGHVYAQILVPLDGPTFWFSRIFRILESLEKHSGVSCGFNIAHSVQQWLPFAQMPHHHDWHHEGYKGSNYTFSSLGGLWDCIFGTRKGGRFKVNHYAAATREDLRSATAGVGRAGLGNSIKKGERGGRGGGGFFFLKNPLWPLVGLTVLVGMKLRANGCY